MEKSLSPPNENQQSVGARLLKKHGASVLEVTRFGHSQVECVWAETQGIRAISASALAAGLDWLQNLSVIQIEKNLVVSYFLSSFERGGSDLILRVSVPLSGDQSEVDAPSVGDIWSQASYFEAEASELFGIRFQTTQNLRESRLLPEGWKGFPLRKDYVFPSEWLGMKHVREEGDLG